MEQQTELAESAIGTGDPSMNQQAVTCAPVDGSGLSGGESYSNDVGNVTTDPTAILNANVHSSGTTDGDPNSMAAYGMSHIAGYDTVNGGDAAAYHSMEIVENGNVTAEAGAAQTAESQFEDAYTPEEERLWSMVRTNGLDFNAWTALIEETERVAENNTLKIRKVYDAFLVEFPLCFGYWKKYADHELRLQNIEKVVEVYERAVLAVTYSVDIWLHYCVFAISTYEDPDVIRRLFERGLAYVGTDYLSYPLWDEYIRYEESHQAWSHLAMIYTRILENPIQQLDRYYNCFKELSASRPLSEIRTAEEAAMMTATVETTPQGLEGENAPDGEPPSKLVSGGLTEAEELEKYVAIREELYKKAKEFDSKIVGFETAIRRPYFHVKPLDDPELENWHNYLDFIERGDDFNKVVKLYERCLIACASYPEFWIRYVYCMEASGSMELANNALARATQVFVKKQPEIHLFAARFKEMNEDIPGARAAYEHLYSDVSPYLIVAIVKHANMEYRLGNHEAAFSVYEKFIAVEKVKEQSPLLPILLVQYSRFLYLVAGNFEKAKETLAGDLEYVQLSKPILEAVIHLESIQSPPKRVEYLDLLVEKFISPSTENTASVADREEISSIFLEFLDLFGDKASLRKAENRHAMLFLRQKSLIVSKKRHAEDYLSSEKYKMAKSYTGEPSPGQMGAYSHGQKNPAWPQTSQAQGQQWNPGYAPQAGYAAYGGYASYGTQQVPPTAPQSAAYSTYPSTYPAQAYPQQNYAQPPAAYPQQAAAVPQTYYGSY